MSEKIPLNERIVTVSMKRIELCDLLIACTSIGYLLNQNGANSAKWNRLHDHLAQALKKFDEEQACPWAVCTENGVADSKKKWTDNLPEDVRNRLGECRSRRSDIEILVNVKWAAWVAEGKNEEGFTKEDALVSILDLLDANGQFFDLSRGEYDSLKHE